MPLLLKFVEILFNLLYLAILIRIIMSWLRTDQSSAIYRFIHDITEPILLPIKKILPQTGMIDFSPLIALFALGFIQELLLSFISKL